MRHFFPVAVALLALSICLAAATISPAAQSCGNGMIEGGEECDGGPALFIDGDPAKGSCVTGSRCYFQNTCCKFNCQYVGTPAVPCEDGDSCSGPDTCGQFGQCRSGPAVADLTPCDDGSFCNGTESCRNGVCGSHTGDPCPGTVCNECQENTDSCFTPAGTSPCTDNICTSGGTCDGAGTCVDGILNEGPCEDGVWCNGDDACSGGTCSSHTGDPCTESSDGDNNCQESCDEDADACTAPDEEGVSCSNALFCDGVADSCTAGNCVGTGSIACDDGDPCTEETCDEMTNACTFFGPSPDGTPCDDGEVCTLGDVCANAVCGGSAPATEDFCPWSVVEREDPRRDLIKTGHRTDIDGDVCGGTLKIGGGTHIGDDLICDESSGSQVQLASDVIISGDIVSAGAGARVLLGRGKLPYTLVSLLAPGISQEKNDASGYYDLSGTSPLVDDCDAVRNAYPVIAAELDALTATMTSPELRVGPGATETLTAPNAGELNIIDIDGSLRVGKEGLVELDGGGDPDTVLVLRIAGKLDMKLGSSLELAGGLTPSHTLVYVKGKQCKFGDLVLGGGTLFCSPARVKAKRLFAWIGAVFGDGGRMLLGDFSSVRHDPFTGF